jgi:ABC-type transport system involved in multi-copper enzyme maturation permease subunit
MRRILAISLLTLRAAIRFRVVLVMAFLLIAGVIGLPLIIRDDGTAQGFSQIILTYTLTLMTALLGFATLWLSCGILAREIEEAQMQMVAVKPIARWQIWLGKWLGLLALNAALLALTGAAVYGLMQWRSGHLSEKEQSKLRREIFVARKSAKEKTPDYDGMTDKILREKLKNGPPPAGLSLPALRNIVKGQLQSRNTLVPPNYRNQWNIYVGDPEELRDLPMTIQVKVDPPVPGIETWFQTHWEFGDPNTQNQFETNILIPGEASIEFTIPPNLLTKQNLSDKISRGTLMVRMDNLSEKPMLFSDENGLEVLYQAGGFGWNFARGLAIILSWLALLAALGLTASTFLSFPVAAFVSIAILFVSLSSGTLKQIVSENGIVAVNPNSGVADSPNLLNMAAVPLAKALLWTFNLARGFSPIDSLSSGRAITWGELGRAVFQVAILLSGVLAAVGIFIFSRRELATAQK